MVHVVSHAILITVILGDLGFAEERIPRFHDNHGTIQVASKTRFKGRTKHVTRVRRKRGNHIEICEHEGAIKDTLT